MNPNTPERSGRRKISIFDTTLRDGEQAPGNVMTAEHKLDLGLRLEALGADVIEAGCPASSSEDFKAAQLLASALSTATVATFCRAVPADVEIAVDAVGVERHQVQVLATASEMHLEHKRGISQADAVNELVGAVKVAASLGVTNISLGLEDASRGTPGLLRALIESGIDAGATTVAVGDTTGCLMPAQFADLIAEIRGWIPRETILSVHCHDDMGLALANALGGIEAGADEVQATLAGIGERSGNTALEELVAVLHYHGASMGVRTDVKPELLYESFQALQKIIGLGGLRNKAIVGENSFATQAGIHQAGILRKPETYEYIEPERFGRERALLVGRQSGRSIIQHLLADLGVAADAPLVAALYDELIADRATTDGETLEATRVKIVDWLAAHKPPAIAVS